MKTASHVVSWIGGIITSIVSYTNIINNSYLFDYNTRKMLLGVWIGALVLRLIILILRQMKLSYNNKGRYGVITLLFVSFIGGILTFCIPDDTPYVAGSSSVYKRSFSQNAATMTEAEKSRKADLYKSLREKGTITQAEYENKLASLGLRNNEDKTIEILEKYKKLLDDNVITQEEFNAKKTELLNK